MRHIIKEKNGFLKGIFTLLAVFTFILSNAQNNHRIYLNKRAEDDKIKKSHAIIPVYKYVSTTIESFDMFGVNKKPVDSEPLNIKKLPDMSRSRDTAYSYIYFSGANTDVTQGYLLTLIGNYRRSSRTVYFYIDRNNNLDFTDDGAPDSLPYGKMELEVELKNYANPEASHKIRLSRIRYGKNLAYKSMLTDHFKKNSGSKIFTNINYCYREQRLNTLSGDFSQGSDSFKLAIKDMNVSGLFNESCVDRFYIGPITEPVTTDDMLEIQPNFESTLFEWNKKQYKITNIEPSGKYIDIQQVEYPKLQKKLKKGKAIDDFSFTTVENNRDELSNYKKEEVYLFVWDLKSLSKEDQKYLKLIHDSFSNDIQIIALNHGDHPKKVRIFQYYDEIEWKIGYSSGFIARQLFIEATPTGFYLGKRCKLKQTDVSPKMMYETLKSD